MELISLKGFELRHDFLHASLPVKTGDNTFCFNADIGKPVCPELKWVYTANRYVVIKKFTCKLVTLSES